MVFHGSLSNSKYSFVSKTLRSIQAVLNPDVIWMVSIRSPISNSSSPFSNPMGTVPSALITIGITVTFVVLPRELNTCLSFHFLWFSIGGPQERQN